MAKKQSKKAKIEALLKNDMTPQEIADKLKVKKQYVYVVKHNMKRDAEADKIDLNKLIKTAKTMTDGKPLFAGLEVPDFLKADMVNHPPHYKRNGIEVIDVIEAFCLNYRMGNVIKYALRHDGKGGLEDLKKARWYLDREISKYE